MDEGTLRTLLELRERALDAAKDALAVATREAASSQARAREAELALDAQRRLIREHAEGPRSAQRAESLARSEAYLRGLRADAEPLAHAHGEALEQARLASAARERARLALADARAAHELALRLDAEARRRAALRAEAKQDEELDELAARAHQPSPPRPRRN